MGRSEDSYREAREADVRVRERRALATVRRAYERSRITDALVALWPVPILLGLVAVLHGHAGVGAVVACGALAGLLAVATWSGHSWRRGALAGVLAGLLPLIIPATVVAMRGQVHCAGCTPSTGNMLACAIVCIATSLVAGVAVGIAAARDRSPIRFAAAALAAAALVGLIACGAVGVGGSLGIVVGVVAGGVPAVALARRAV